MKHALLLFSAFLSVYVLIQLRDRRRPRTALRHFMRRAAPFALAVLAILWALVIAYYFPSLKLL